MHSIQCSLVTPPPVGGRSIIFGRFLSFFIYFFVATLRENGWTDLHEIFREGVEWPWDDLIQFLVNSGKQVGGSKVKLFVIWFNCGLLAVPCCHLASENVMKLLFLAFRYVAERGRGLLCLAPQLVHVCSYCSQFTPFRQEMASRWLICFNSQLVLPCDVAAAWCIFGWFLALWKLLTAVLTACVSSADCMLSLSRVTVGESMLSALLSAFVLTLPEPRRSRKLTGIYGIVHKIARQSFVPVAFILQIRCFTRGAFQSFFGTMLSACLKSLTFDCRRKQPCLLICVYSHD